MDWFFDFSPWLSLSACLVGFVMGFKELGEFNQDIKGKRGWERSKVVFALLGWWLMAISGLWAGIASFMESGKAEIEMEALRSELRSAKAETEAIKERNRFREITAAQKAAILRELKEAPKGRIRIVSAVPDIEILQFTMQLKDVLFEAGYEDATHGGKSNLQDGTWAVGVIFRCQKLSKATAHGPPIQRALKNVGVAPQFLDTPHIDPDIVEIVVGRKAK